MEVPSAYHGCEAQGCHNRSLPKEPREAKQISLHRAFGIQLKLDQAVKLQGCLLLL